MGRIRGACFQRCRWLFFLSLNPPGEKAVLTSEQNILFVFPGQGSQYVGMGSDLHTEHAVARQVYETASDVLGYDIPNSASMTRMTS